MYDDRSRSTPSAEEREATHGALTAREEIVVVDRRVGRATRQPTLVVANVEPRLERELRFPQLIRLAGDTHAKAAGGSVGDHRTTLAAAVLVTGGRSKQRETNTTVTDARLWQRPQ